MAKRSNGEGSIYKRNDGYWCGSRYITMADGTSKRKSVYGKTQKEVKAKMKALENYVEKPVETNLSLQDWMVRWMTDYKYGVLKVTTYEDYLMYINTYIKGTILGQTLLKNITTEMLQNFYNTKLKGSDGKRKLSRRSVEYLHTLIGSSLEQACRNGILEKNANRYTVLPKKIKTKIEPLTIEDVQKVLEEAKGTRIYPLLVLEIYTGMRKGEVLGLQWKDIDFDNKLLHVKNNLCRIKNQDEEVNRKTKLVLLKPKTEGSIRTLPLSDIVIKVLKEHKMNQEKEKEHFKDIYVDRGMVFARADGYYDCPRETLRRFHQILEKAGVRKCRFHDLRHTFASILINEGESMKNIQELLGHSTITTTMDVYSHISKEAKVRSIQKLENAVNNDNI